MVVRAWAPIVCRSRSNLERRELCKMCNPNREHRLGAEKLVSRSCSC